MEQAEDEDEENPQEEEEEVEEKKEKVVKKTIKKKRPYQNVTNDAMASQKHVPYRTIMKVKKGTSVKRLRPLLSQENVEILNPITYYDKTVRKGIQPRDVNLILRTRHSPRIVIRKYKPLFGASAGLNFIDQRPQLQYQPLRAKKKRKRRKKRKRIQYSPVQNAEYYSPYPTPTPVCNDHSNHQGGSYHVGGYPYYGTHTSDTLSYQYSPSNDYYWDNYHMARTPNHGHSANDYSNLQYENHPSESYTTIPFLSTELPYFEKTEYASPKEDMPNGSYDVREHENTEELANNHQEETDASLDDEEGGSPKSQNEGENDKTEEYEETNEEEEEEEDLNPKWNADAFFAYAEGRSKAIKKRSK